MRSDHVPTQLASPSGSTVGGGSFDPPFDVLGLASPLSPLVFSSPHSGSVYPACFTDIVRLDALSLRRSEDAFVDDLFAGALDVGAPLLRARFPRAWLDVNREPYELDPRMFDGRLPSFANTRSIRVAGGLGTIARVVGEAQEIYAGRLSVAEGLERVETLYKPYHAALLALMVRARELHGSAFLVDCHSMPSSAARPSVVDNLPVDMVLGDRHGASCGRLIMDVAEAELRARGYRVLRNKPYAGGYITETYGNPANGWHAMQIEINRGIYMNERTLEKGPNYERLKADLSCLVRALAAGVESAGTSRLAAE
jgi:N-formylglutamate deformylase